MSSGEGGLLGWLKGATPAQAAVNSGDPKVIIAVTHAETMKLLLWIGSLAMLGGVGLFFVSNNFLPSSTPVGGGLAGAGLGMILLVIFEEELKNVAQPAFVVLACAGVLLLIWLGLERFIFKKGRCKHDHPTDD